MGNDLDLRVQLVADEFGDVVKKYDRVVAKQAELAQQKGIYQTEAADPNTSPAAKKKLAKELAKIEAEEKITAAKQAVLEANTVEEKLDAERQLRSAEAEKRRLDNAQKVADSMTKAIKGAIENILSRLNSEMESAAKTYSSYVDRISTRLVGSNDTYSSIANKLNTVFGASPIFQMKNVMENVAKVVESGINFNAESRAAMVTVADKVAKTFNAFDSSLLRIIRIQQADSTQARLGMESMLTEFLNRTYQDSSYLTSNLSSSVSANILEAMSILDRENSTAFEYAVQKWAGSMQAVGVSDNLVQQLTQGIGYLASGNVQALASNAQLESLLVAAANRSGLDYGQLLINGVSVDNVNDIFRGVASLVSEIGSSENKVAVSQYAQVFGMAMSDIQAMKNIIDKESLDTIASDMQSYAQLKKRVDTETSLTKLLSRTGGAELGDNLYQNFLWNAGRVIGNNAVTYAAWKLSNNMAGLLRGIETGVDIQPFGMGTHLNLGVSTLAQAVITATGAVAGLSSMLTAAGSLAGVNLGKLTEESAKKRVSTGDLTTFATEGTKRTETSYYGDTSDSALAATSNALTKDAAAKYTDDSYDEEKAKTEKTMESMKEIGDNVKFIVQLLNERGIVIRGRTGTVEPVSFFDDLASYGTDSKKSAMATLGVI